MTWVTYQRETQIDQPLIAIVSVIIFLLDTLFILSDNELLYLVAFAIEIAVCVADLALKRNTLETLIHHVFTPVCIFLSLQVPGLSPTTLVMSSMAVSGSNFLVCSTKIGYQRYRLWSNHFGLTIAFFASVIGRVFLCLYVVIHIGKYMLIELDGRPGWTRLYISGLLMLYSLGLQMTWQIWQKRIRTSREKWY
jgi:hypothetical protein